MQFPKRFGILLARISLGRFMSPELANHTIEEIRNAIRELTDLFQEPMDQNPDHSAGPCLQLQNEGIGPKSQTGPEPAPA